MTDISLNRFDVVTVLKRNYSVSMSHIVEANFRNSKLLYDASTNHSIRGDRYKHGRSVIKSVGVYPYCFLSKECSIERMDNPVKLIQEKLEDIGIAV